MRGEIVGCDPGLEAEDVQLPQRPVRRETNGAHSQVPALGGGYEPVAQPSDPGLGPPIEVDQPTAPSLSLDHRLWDSLTRLSWACCRLQKRHSGGLGEVGRHCRSGRYVGVSIPRHGQVVRVAPGGGSGRGRRPDPQWGTSTA